ncbi:uncharacterized protein LOC136027319 [Artemia franciscana]|uniref:Uncharacterized protein n=1 Tax=Artemia franciscana TaxID=6661 RepID=A0AA88L5Z5_ARTSF|nr:hypothetical protein QYM36_013009 [Artemia franciscana]
MKILLISGFLIALSNTKSLSNYGQNEVPPESTSYSPTSDYGISHKRVYKNEESNHYGTRGYPETSATYSSDEPSGNYASTSTKDLLGEASVGHDYTLRNNKMPYTFAWHLDDLHSHYGHKETNDGEKVYGEYYVSLPNEKTQVVKYNVSGTTGFVATVDYVETGYPKILYGHQTMDGIYANEQDVETYGKGNGYKEADYKENKKTTYTEESPTLHDESYLSVTNEPNRGNKHTGKAQYIESDSLTYEQTKLLSTPSSTQNYSDPTYDSQDLPHGSKESEYKTSTLNYDEEDGKKSYNYAIYSEKAYEGPKSSGSPAASDDYSVNIKELKQDNSNLEYNSDKEYRHQDKETSRSYVTKQEEDSGASNLNHYEDQYSEKAYITHDHQLPPTYENNANSNTPAEYDKNTNDDTKSFKEGTAESANIQHSYSYKGEGKDYPTYSTHRLEASSYATGSLKNANEDNYNQEPEEYYHNKENNNYDTSKVFANAENSSNTKETKAYLLNQEYEQSYEYEGKREGFKEYSYPSESYEKAEHINYTEPKEDTEKYSKGGTNYDLSTKSPLSRKDKISDTYKEDTLPMPKFTAQEFLIHMTHSPLFCPIAASLMQVVKMRNMKNSDKVYLFGMRDEGTGTSDIIHEGDLTEIYPDTTKNSNANSKEYSATRDDKSSLYEPKITHESYASKIPYNSHNYQEVHEANQRTGFKNMEAPVVYHKPIYQPQEDSYSKILTSTKAYTQLDNHYKETSSYEPPQSISYPTSTEKYNNMDHELDVPKYESQYILKASNTYVNKEESASKYADQEVFKEVQPPTYEYIKNATHNHPVEKYEKTEYTTTELKYDFESTYQTSTPNYPVGNANIQMQEKTYKVKEPSYQSISSYELAELTPNSSEKSEHKNEKSEYKNTPTYQETFFFGTEAYSQVYPKEKYVEKTHEIEEPINEYLQKHESFGTKSYNSSYENPVPFGYEYEKPGYESGTTYQTQSSNQYNQESYTSENYQKEDQKYYNPPSYKLQKASGGKSIEYSNGGTKYDTSYANGSTTLNTQTVYDKNYEKVYQDTHQVKENGYLLPSKHEPTKPKPFELTEEQQVTTGYRKDGANYKLDFDKTGASAEYSGNPKGPAKEKPYKDLYKIDERKFEPASIYQTTQQNFSTNEYKQKEIEYNTKEPKYATSFPYERVTSAPLNSYTEKYSKGTGDYKMRESEYKNASKHKPTRPTLDNYSAEKEPRYEKGDIKYENNYQERTSHPYSASTESYEDARRVVTPYKNEESKDKSTSSYEPANPKPRYPEVEKYVDTGYKTDDKKYDASSVFETSPYIKDVNKQEETKYGNEPISSEAASDPVHIAGSHSYNEGGYHHPTYITKETEYKNAPTYEPAKLVSHNHETKKYVENGYKKEEPKYDRSHAYTHPVSSGEEYDEGEKTYENQPHSNLAAPNTYPTSSEIQNDRGYQTMHRAGNTKYTDPQTNEPAKLISYSPEAVKYTEAEKKMEEPIYDALSTYKTPSSSREKYEKEATKYEKQYVYKAIESNIYITTEGYISKQPYENIEKAEYDDIPPNEQVKYSQGFPQDTENGYKIEDSKYDASSIMNKNPAPGRKVYEKEKIKYENQPVYETAPFQSYVESSQRYNDRSYHQTTHKVENPEYKSIPAFNLAKPMPPYLEVEKTTKKGYEKEELKYDTSSVDKAPTSGGETGNSKEYAQHTPYSERNVSYTAYQEKNNANQPKQESYSPNVYEKIDSNYDNSSAYKTPASRGDTRYSKGNSQPTSYQNINKSDEPKYETHWQTKHKNEKTNYDIAPSYDGPETSGNTGYSEGYIQNQNYQDTYKPEKPKYEMYQSKINKKEDSSYDGSPTYNNPILSKDTNYSDTLIEHHNYQEGYEIVEPKYDTYETKEFKPYAISPDSYEKHEDKKTGKNSEGPPEISSSKSHGDAEPYAGGYHQQIQYNTKGTIYENPSVYKPVENGSYYSETEKHGGYKYGNEDAILNEPSPYKASALAELVSYPKDIPTDKPHQESNIETKNGYESYKASNFKPYAVSSSRNGQPIRDVGEGKFHDGTVYTTTATTSIYKKYGEENRHQHTDHPQIKYKTEDQQGSTEPKDIYSKKFSGYSTNVGHSSYIEAAINPAKSEVVQQGGEAKEYFRPMDPIYRAQTENRGKLNEERKNYNY